MHNARDTVPSCKGNRPYILIGSCSIKPVQTQAVSGVVLKTVRGGGSCTGAVFREGRGTGRHFD